jgi:leucyl aminopeptidase
MQSHLFYQTDVEQACPFFILSKTDPIEHLPLVEQTILLSRQFKGGLGEAVLIHQENGSLCKLYIGSGDGDDAQAIAYAVAKMPPGLYCSAQALSKRAQLIWSLAQYAFDRYKKPISSPRVLMVASLMLPALLLESQAVFHVRDLINMPANELGPREMASVVEALAQQYGAEFKQWEGDALLHDNFPAIHAVGRAAADAPRLLSVTWGNEAHPKVVLVGKGVCFDSGGLDLKPASGMRLMKKDMGGAAHVIGLAQLVMAQKIPVRLHVLIPAVENAIGSRAFRPGDVLTMRNGLSVEIDNTDAEGRLVLADAMVLACEDPPELLIDFATLTGAARVAVGTEIAAMFTNDDDLANALMDASLKTQDPVWRMPLFAGYANMLDSSIADLANSSASAYAGAITAALFLQRFLTPSVSWLHFDIMAWNVSNKPGRPEGGEAMGLLAVFHYLMHQYPPVDNYSVP